MSQFIPTPIPAEIPPAQKAADRMIHNFNAEFSHRVQMHRQQFRVIWRNPNITPDEIMAGLGTQAATILAAASESIQHLGRLATIIGKDVTDFIPPEDFTPPRELIPNADGTVTIAPPADGFDAWGNPIPEPEPETTPEV